LLCARWCCQVRDKHQSKDQEFHAATSIRLIFNNISVIAEEDIEDEVLTLDALAEESAQAAEDEEFNKIMGL